MIARSSGARPVSAPWSCAVLFRAPPFRAACVPPPKVRILSSEAAVPPSSPPSSLPASIAQALRDKGYETLTPVQLAVSDPDLTDADLLVSAQTGSGKTVAFGMAIAPTLLEADGRFSAPGAPLGLIIAPTRELAMQVRRELAWLYGPAGAVLTSCVGGMDARDERRALGRGAHVVVATPGRLRDHIERGNIDLSKVRAVVLDEADEMLDLGFREDLEFILGAAPEDRRTLMFSATVPPAIASLAQLYQRDAKRISTRSEARQHADIAYRAMVVGPRDEENAIINVLRYYEAANAIVFCNTRAMVNRLTTRFSNRGFSVVALSGELTQAERTHALQAMRDGRARVCVATDVAARGIDLPNLELVIHAELPTSSDTLLHRSGRTGRAGRKGVSAVIVPVKFRKKAERLLKWAKITPEWASPPSADEVRAQDETRLLDDPSWIEPVPEAEAEIVARMVDRFTPEQLAATVLRTRARQSSAPEELSASDAAPAPRAPFGPSAWFSLSVGRDSRAEARWILPLLCRVGGFDREEIGAIRIQQDQTFVEILESAVPDPLKAPDAAQELEEGAVLTRLATAPDLSQRDGSGPERKPREGAPRVPKSAGKGGPHRGAPRPSPRPPREDRGSRPYTPRADAAPEADTDARKPRHKPSKPDAPYTPNRSADADQRPPSKRPDAKPARAKESGKDGYKGGGKRPAKPYRDHEAGGKPAHRKSGGPSGGYKGGADKPGQTRSGPGKPPRAREDRAASFTERSDAAPRGPKPANDPSQRLGPDGKPVRGKGRPGGNTSGKPRGKFDKKPGGKPGGAADGKPGRKPFVGKGANAVPKRRGPKT